MPTDRMFAYFAGKLHFKRQWRVNGKHYSAQCEDWLKNLDANSRKGGADFGRDVRAGESHQVVRVLAAILLVVL